MTHCLRMKPTNYGICGSNQRSTLHIGDEGIRKNGDGEASPALKCASEGSHRPDSGSMRNS